MRFLLLISTVLLFTGFRSADPEDECSGDHEELVDELLGTFTFDNLARVPVIRHTDGVIVQEYRYTLFNLPEYRFGIDKKALGEKGVINIYKRVSRKEKELVFTSKGKTDDIVYFSPDPKQRKYIITVMVPPFCQPGCVLIALGYKTKNDVIDQRPNEGKPRIRVVD